MSVQATVISSPLTAAGRKYVCPQEQPTYVCNGTGSVIDIYAPPAIPLGTPISFVRGNDIVGIATRIDPLFVTLFSTEYSSMVVNIQVTDPTTINRIVCDVESEVDEVMLQVSGM